MQVHTTYERAVPRKYPEQVAYAIAKDAEGKYNPITLGWVMPTSHHPPMLAISVGLTRHSLQVIRNARAFVIAYPSAAMAEDARFFGTRSGRDIDKLAARGTATQPAKVIDGVLIADAVLNFECTLESELTTGDHVIFVGRIVASHVHSNPKVQRLYTVGPDYRMDGVAGQ